jgi:hypothetical protein
MEPGEMGRKMRKRRANGPPPNVKERRNRK